MIFREYINTFVSLANFIVKENLMENCLEHFVFNFFIENFIKNFSNHFEKILLIIFLNGDAHKAKAKK